MPPRITGKSVSIVWLSDDGSFIDGRGRRRAGGEVLDLALSIDRRVGDDRDRLLEVVGQVLPLRREAARGPS